MNDPRTPQLPPRTEFPHPETGTNISPERWLELCDAQEGPVAAAIASRTPEILALGQAMAATLDGPGRIIHLGAGTSGRLGVLDAAEWPPTFGVAPERVMARIAGGPMALTAAVEGAEDDESAGREELSELAVGVTDLVVGISASGSAPYVMAGLAAARERGARRGLISAAPSSVGDPDMLRVELQLGPELLAGSTRLQAATATHRVLQRVSSVCALELGWIHRGRMVEMRPTNRKLRDRAVGIVAELARIGAEDAAARLDAADDDIKVAIVSAACRLDPESARARLAAVGRRLDAFEELR